MVASIFRNMVLLRAGILAPQSSHLPELRNPAPRIAAPLFGPISTPREPPNHPVDLRGALDVSDIHLRCKLWPSYAIICIHVYLPSHRKRT